MTTSVLGIRASAYSKKVVKTNIAGKCFTYTIWIITSRKKSVKIRCGNYIIPKYAISTWYFRDVLSLKSNICIPNNEKSVNTFIIYDLWDDRFFLVSEEWLK